MSRSLPRTTSFQTQIILSYPLLQTCRGHSCDFAGLCGQKAVPEATIAAHRSLAYGRKFVLPSRVGCTGSENRKPSAERDGSSVSACYAVGYSGTNSA